MQDSNTSPSTLRVGHVTEFNPETLCARVNFPELGITSYWLPLLVMNTLKTHDEYFLDEGEHVVCLMQGTGLESGFVLGAIYDAKNKPPVHDPDKRSVTFDDDTFITYDRKNHKLVIDCSGEIEINAKNHIVLNAARIDLN